MSSLSSPAALPIAEEPVVAPVEASVVAVAAFFDSTDRSSVHLNTTAAVAAVDIAAAVAADTAAEDTVEEPPDTPDLGE